MNMFTAARDDRTMPIPKSAGGAGPGHAKPGGSALTIGPITALPVDAGPDGAPPARTGPTAAGQTGAGPVAAGEVGAAGEVTEEMPALTLADVGAVEDPQPSPGPTDAPTEAVAVTEESAADPDAAAAGGVTPVSSSGLDPTEDEPRGRGRTAKAAVLLLGLVVGTGLVVAGVVWGLHTAPEPSATPLDTQPTTSSTDVPEAGEITGGSGPVDGDRLPTPGTSATDPSSAGDTGRAPAADAGSAPGPFRYPDAYTDPYGPVAPPPPPPGAQPRVGAPGYAPTPGAPGPGAPLDDPYAVDQPGGRTAPPARPGARSEADRPPRDSERSTRPLDSLAPDDSEGDDRSRREPLDDVPDLGGLGRR